MKVFIIGSISCADEIKKVAEMFIKAGDKVDYVHSQPEYTFEYLVEKAFGLISEADKIIAVTKPDGSFGEGTIYELTFAKFLEKEIIIWDGDDYGSY